MIVYENDCCSCDLPCIDCGRKHSPHYYCDSCGEEDEEMYEDKETKEHICSDCMKKRYKRIDL